MRLQGFSYPWLSVTTTCRHGSGVYLSGTEKIEASPICRILLKHCLVLELHKNDNMDSMKYFSDFLKPDTRDKELHLMFKTSLNC